MFNKVRAERAFFKENKGPFLKKAGFTLMEMIIAIGIFVVILWFGAILDISSYRQNSIRAERDNVVALLSRARSEALSNLNQSNHGLFLGGSSQYVVYQGANYASRNPTYDEDYPSSGDTISGLSDVNFNNLDGSSNASGTITISDGINSYNVYINYEGRIDW